MVSGSKPYLKELCQKNMAIGRAALLIWTVFILKLNITFLKGESIGQLSQLILTFS